MEQPETCDVCEEPFVLGGWGIPHGQGICGHCGAVYMLAGDDAPTCILDDDGKRIAREYYEETGEPAVLVQNDGVTGDQVDQFNIFGVESPSSTGEVMRPSEVGRGR